MNQIVFNDAPSLVRSVRDVRSGHGDNGTSATTSRHLEMCTGKLNVVVYKN